MRSGLLATLTEVIANALVRRGADELTAELVARTGMTVLNVATTRWLAADDGRELAAHLHETLTALRSVTT